MQIYQHFQHQKKSCQSCTCRNCRNRIAESWGYNSAILFWVAETAEAAADSISTCCRIFCWYLQGVSKKRVISEIWLNDVCLYSRTCRGYRVHCRHKKMFPIVTRRALVFFLSVPTSYERSERPARATKSNLASKFLATLVYNGWKGCGMV